MTRHAIGTVVLVALLAGAAWLLLRGGESAEAPSQAASMPGGANEVAASREVATRNLKVVATPFRDDEAVSRPAAAESRGGLFLRGRLEIKGEVSGARVATFVAAPMATGADFDFNAYAWSGFRQRGVALPKVTSVADGAAYAIPVPERGEYSCTARVAGARNEYEWQQNNRQVSFALTLAVVPAIAITIQGDVTALPLDVFAPLTSGAAKATRGEAGKWTMVGPFLLPVRVTLVLRGGLECHVWVKSAEETVVVPACESVSLHVVDAFTRAPIAGVSADVVEGMHSMGFRARFQTDADGTAVLQLPVAPADPRVELTESAHAPAVLFSPRLSAHSGVIEVALVPADRPGGMLLDEAGHAMAGARVYLPSLNGSLNHGTTGADGRFVLHLGSNITGTGNLADSPHGMSGPASRFLVLLADASRAVTVPFTWDELLRASWVGRVPTAHSLAVRVVDDLKSKPVVGAHMKWFPVVDGNPTESMSTKAPDTDTTGVSALGTVRSGEWGVRIDADGYASVKQTLEPGADGVAEVRLAAPVQLVVHLATRDAQPVVGVGVNLTGVVSLTDGAWVKTDATGAAHFTLNKGMDFYLSLHIFEPGLVASRATPQTITAVTGDIRITMVRAGKRKLDLRCSDGHRIESACYEVVTEPPASGPPFPYVWKAVRPEVDLTDEPAVMRVYAAGCLPDEVRLVPDAETAANADIVFNLRPGPRVTGTVGAGAADARPARAIVVKMRALPALRAPTLRDALYTTQGFASCATVAADGRFSVGPLTPGRYQLTAVDEAGAELATREIDVVLDDLNIGALR